MRETRFSVPTNIMLSKTINHASKVIKMRNILMLIIICSFAFITQAHAAQNMNDQDLIKALQRIFSERPDLIINVLRENSELVLDIAQEGSTKRRKRNLEAQWREEMKVAKEVALDDRPIRGPKNAPITVIEFSDFTCPYCAQAAANLKKIMQSYGDNVRLIFKHTPLSGGPTSILASEYVIAAGFQSHEKAWDLYDACFEKRDELLEKGETFLKEEASKLGLDVVKLARDAKGKKTKQILEQDLADAKKLDIEGTPYFLVNNAIVRGALPLELFRTVFELATKKK